MRKYYRAHSEELKQKRHEHYMTNHDKYISYARDVRRTRGKEMYARYRRLHPLHNIHNAILARCGLRTCSNKYIVSAYAWRGITVCDEWKDMKTFESWCLSHGWKKGLQIDRINNDKGYSPDNFRFVTRKENCRNRRSNRIVEYKGERKTLVEFVESGCTKLKYDSTLQRLRDGWSVEEAFETPKVTNQYRKESRCA